MWITCYLHHYSLSCYILTSSHPSPLPGPAGSHCSPGTLPEALLEGTSSSLGAVMMMMDAMNAGPGLRAVREPFMYEECMNCIMYEESITGQ